LSVDFKTTKLLNKQAILAFINFIALFLTLPLYNEMRHRKCWRNWKMQPKGAFWKPKMCQNAFAYSAPALPQASQLDLGQGNMEGGIERVRKEKGT